MTVCFVTHDINEALFLGTRTVVLSQYYTDGRGDNFKRGARIVADYALPKHALSTDAMKDPRFAELRDTIIKEGFNPAFHQATEEFNLTHPDAFRSVLEEEKIK